MFTNIALLGLTLAALPHGGGTVRPRIEVWSNHGDAVYTRSQGVRVYFRADQDGFVTLFRVDTDGRVRVLFPRDPWEDNFVRGGREYEALGSSSHNAFFVDDYPGVGYLFAVVAADPFDYRAIESGDHWDYRAIADGRVRGDPYVALTDLAERIVPEGYADWDYDIAPYHVERHYDYPRFLCYDCHAYASYTYWDPYWRSCVRFRIVVYDDPYYYPYRYYGRRAVFVRPFRPQPRFVFKDRDGSNRDRFVTREPLRPVNDDTRRVAPTRRVTGTNGIVPAPRDEPRRERPQPGQDEVRRREQPDGSAQSGSDANRRRVVRPDADDVPARTGRLEPRARGESDESRPGLQERGRARTDQRVEPRTDDRGRGNDVLRGRAGDRDAPRAEPRRVEPRQSRPEPRESRVEPRAPSRSEPRAQARPEPRRSEPRAQAPSAAPQRSQPRSEPKQKSQPELKRRRPE
jgi:hypothetical protein